MRVTTILDNLPSGMLTVDPARQYLYVAGGYELRRIDLQTQANIRVAGNGTTDVRYNVDALDTSFFASGRMAVDQAGNIYAPDVNGCGVLRLEPRNNFTSYFLTRVAGQGPDPVTLTCGYGGDGGAAIDADVAVVGEMTFDRFGNLFFVQNAFAGGAVLRRIAAGADGLISGAADEIITTIAGGGTTWPPNGNPHEVGFGGSLKSVTFSPQGDLYLGVSSQVSRLTRAPGAEVIDGRPGEVLASVSGGTSLDFAAFQGDGGPARDADWFGTGSVVILPNGDLIVSDSGFNRLRRISAGADGIVNGGADEMVSTFAGFTENFPNVPFNGDGYALSTSLFYPDLVLNDPRGGLLVVDLGHNRLRHIGVGVATGTGADLAVTVTAPATVGAGGTIHYTVVITNNGPSPATQVGLSLPVSAANLLGVTATSPAGFCVVPLLFLVPAGTVSCDAGTLAPNASITLTVDATLRTNPLFSTETATFTVGGHEQDIVTDNNTRTVETEIEPSVDLLVVPVAPALTGTVIVGAPVTFRMTVTNVGGAAAQTARLNFHPPAGLQFVSASMLGAFCEFVGFLVCDIDNIAPGASVDALVVVTPLASGPVTATFTISSPNFDLDLANNAITFNVNRAPIANAGADQNIAINPTTGTADVVVSSASSSDPDGDPLVFTWSRNGELLGNFPAVSQLLPIGNYVYTLTANDGRGGIATDTVEVIVHGTGLPAPTNVSAQATAPGTVTISWNPVPGASGYRILRSPDPVTLQIPVEPPVHVMIGSPVTFDVTGTSTVDSGLPTLVRQYYAVQAINGAIVSLPTPAQGGEVMVTAEPDAEIFGVADFHNHQFANLGFGRSLIWGSAFSPAGILNALPACDAVHGPGGLHDLIGNFATTPPGSLPFPVPITVPSITFTPPNEPPITTPSLTVLMAGHFTNGVTANNSIPFNGWPRWNSITHQQVYYEWLRRAFDGGLRLMVMHALNNKLLCQISGTVNQTLGNFSCNDMDNIDDQLNMAKGLEAFVDGQSGGPGKGWYRIAYSATEARHIINSGKMAVILGVEVDDLFNCSLASACTEQFVRERLNHYYNMGVRHLFPVHVFDNAFGGTALYSSLFDVGNRLVEGQFVERRECDPEGYDYKALLDPLAPTLGLPQAAMTTFAADCNERPLQPLGDFLIREMMAKGMIIDIDHMSAATAHLVMARAEQYGYAGVMTGHSGSMSVLQGTVKSEGAKTPAQLARIRAIGGVSGIFAGQGDRVRSGNLNGVLTHPGSTVVNDCGNSSKTFAQVYLATVDALGGPGTASVGFGTDFNGMASMPGPRFGSESCWGDNEQSPQANRVTYPFTIASRPGIYAGRLGQPTSPLEPPPNVRQKTWDINEDGLAHVGMLPDFIQELRNVGVTETQLQPLFRSAEGYIRMWERAEATAPAVTPPASVTVASTESGGARGNASTELQSFLLGGSAVGFGSVTRLAPQVGGVVANDQTLFPLGATEVTFRFSDSAGHIGSATATVTVVQGSGTVVIDDGVDVNLFADGGSLIGTLRFSDVQQEGFVTATVPDDLSGAADRVRGAHAGLRHRHDGNLWRGHRRVPQRFGLPARRSAAASRRWGVDRRDERRDGAHHLRPGHVALTVCRGAAGESSADGQRGIVWTVRSHLSGRGERDAHRKRKRSRRQ